MRLLWVVPDLGMDAGTIMAAWTIPLLLEAGVDVEILPMAASRGREADFSGARVLPPAVTRRLTARLEKMGVLRRAFGQYDRIVLDQDLDLEIQALLAARSAGRRARTILFARIPLSPYLAARGEHAIGRLRRLIDRFYPEFDRIVSWSQAVASDLVLAHRVPKERVMHLPAPLPFAQWHRDAGWRPADWPFGDGPVVATMGRLDPLKGVEVLIQALRLLAEEGVAARLLVIGDGPGRPDLERQAKALGIEAAFPGWVDHPEGWLRQADLYVAPQYFDGSGWDLYMAMGAGLAVIATDGPAVSTEVLLKGMAGRIVTIGEPPALARAMGEWLRDSKTREGFAIGALQRARGLDRDRHKGRWLKALTD